MRRPEGRASLAEFAPGFRAAPLGLDAGWLPPPVARELGLAALERSIPGGPVAVPVGGRANGSSLAIAIRRRAAEAIRRYSPGDAGRWPAFCDADRRASRDSSKRSTRFRRPTSTPPRFGDCCPSSASLASSAGLGRAGMVELLRVMPMSVQEMLDDGSTASRSRPRSARRGRATSARGRAPAEQRSCCCTTRSAPRPARSAAEATGRPAPTRLHDARRTRRPQRRGVTIRTGASVSRHWRADDRATGVMLGERARRSLPRRCSPAPIPPARSSSWWIRSGSIPSSCSRCAISSSAVARPGCSTRSTRCPNSRVCPNHADTLARHRCPSRRRWIDLERAADAAKYGRISERPHVEVQMPVAAVAGPGARGEARARGTVQWAPYRLARRRVDRRAARRCLGRAVTAGDRGRGPGLRAHGSGAEWWGRRPNSRRRFGLREGAVTQGRDDARPDPVHAAGRGCVALRRRRLPGLYLCGAGTHPGAGSPEGRDGLPPARCSATGARDGETSHDDVRTNHRILQAGCEDPAG